jgi:two-component system chemotaxis response regulator CheY
MTGLPFEEFIEASNGIEALAAWRATRPDLILTDINMPGMNGEEFLVALRREAAAVPVLVISTDSTRGRQERMRELGARGYLAKPFSPEALRDELERILEVEHV